MEHDVGHNLGHPARGTIIGIPMGSWLLERRLTQNASRLRAVRDELDMVDEQLRSLAEEADDLELRSLVSETPSASAESRDARRHADAMARHRQHLRDGLTDLERQQNELLDRLSSRAPR